MQRITSPMDCRGIAAAALPRESPSSNIRLLIASFFFFHTAGSVSALSRKHRQCSMKKASVCRGAEAAQELYSVLTW